MQKLHIVIRHTNESTLNDCINSIKALGLSYTLISNKKSLEDKVKEMFSKEYKADWILVVDADVILYRVPEILSDKFSLTGKLWDTKRGVIHGLHFYKVSKLQQAYNMIKDVDFSYHLGRQEYEICQYLNKKCLYTQNYDMDPIGVHLWGVNNEN